MTSTRITTPFKRESTTTEVLAGVDLAGKRAVVTGAGSGLGAEIARALVAAGADVTIGVRTLKAGERTAAGITSRTGKKDVRAAILDVADRSSIAEFVAAWQGPLDILVNNAGVMALPERTLTAEGWELQFANNHLGHFALAVGLHDALAAAGNARIVSVSSRDHRLSPVDFDDLFFEQRAYDPWTAYGQSKTANVLFAVEAAKQWAADGILVNAVAPGAVRTSLQRHQMTPEEQAQLDAFPWIPLEQGASTPVLAAASPLLDGVSGRYIEDNNEAATTDEPDAQGGVRSYALDPEAATRLWEVSLDLTSA